MVSPMCMAFTVRLGRGPSPLQHRAAHGSCCLADRAYPNNGFGSCRFAIAVHVEVAPARHALDANPDDGEGGNLHGSQLPISGAKQRLGLIVLGSTGTDLGGSAQQDPAEPRPVVVV